MSKLRIGIIGTGFGARTQAPGFNLHPDCEVVALSGVSRPGRAREQAEQLGIPHAFDDYREMLSEVELDLVSVVSANHLHHPMTIAALERRIHVLCEKPMAFDMAEAEAMLDAAERRNLVHAIDFEYRHLPARTTFKRLVSEGFLGELIHYNLTMSMPGWGLAQRPMGWLWQEESAGGMLSAVGSHLVDTLRWFFGDIHSVSSLLSTHVKERDGQPVTVDDMFAFIARLPGGASGVVQMLPWAHHGFGMRIEAFGTQGVLVLEDDKRLLAGKAGGPLEEVALPARYDVPGVNYPEKLDPYHPAFLVLVDNLINAIRRTGAPGPSRDYATFRDGVAVQGILDAVRQAHREGRWVVVPRYSNVRPLR